MDLRKLICAAALGLVLSGSAAWAKDDASFPVINGEHWANATQQERLAFVAGLTTMVELEKEVQGANPPKDQRTLIPAWVSGLSRFTLQEIVDALNAVYARKPALKAKPIVEVLWYEVAFPKPEDK